MVRRRLLATPPSVVAGSLSPAEGDVITIPAGQTTVDVTFTADCSAAGNQIMSVVYVLFDGNKKVMKVVPELPTDAVDDAHTFETATPVYASENWKWYYVCVTIDEQLVREVNGFAVRTAA